MGANGEYEKQDREKIKAAKKNPLCNYSAQVRSKKMPKKQRLGDTNLSENLKVSFLGYDDETEIKYREDIGNFDYCKLINQDAKMIKRILSLSPSTHTLLTWILLNIEYRNETIVIKRDLVLKSVPKLAVATFKKAISELEIAGIILRIGEKRTEDYWRFFINPQVMWRGDAKRYYNDVVKEHPDFLKS